MNIMQINPQTVEVLVDAWNYCDENDKSTEFMLQYMSDMAGVSYDFVVDFVASYDRATSQFNKPININGKKREGFKKR